MSPNGGWPLSLLNGFSMLIFNMAVRSWCSVWPYMVISCWWHKWTHPEVPPHCDQLSQCLANWSALSWAMDHASVACSCSILLNAIYRYMFMYMYMHVLVHVHLHVHVEKTVYKINDTILVVSNWPSVSALCIRKLLLSRQKYILSPF